MGSQQQERKLMREVKEQREELNMSQQDVAIFLGVSRVTFIKWENDASLMPLGKYNDLMTEFERLRSIKGDN